MAPGLLWGDSGHAQLEILLGSWRLDADIARAHWVYCVIARFLDWLLPLESARVANLVSVLGGALTIANVAWLNATFAGSRVAVACGTALLAFAHTFWQLSTSAEVMTLSTALLTLELMCVVTLVETGRLRWLAAALFANGLGVCNHNFALLMWPVYLATAWRYRRNWEGRCLRGAGVGAAALLVGLAPLLFLCFAHYKATRDLTATLQSALFGHYGSRVLNVSGLPTLLLRSTGAFILNFPTPLVLLGAAGVLNLPRVGRRPVPFLIAGAALVYAIFGVRYDVSDQYTFLLPAYVFVSIFAAIGIDRVIANQRRPATRIAVCVLTPLAPLAYALAPPLLNAYAAGTALMPTRDVPYRNRFEWFLRPWRAGYDGAERYARETLLSLPQSAWLAVDSTLCPPLNYLQVSESLRKDVRLDSWIARQAWLNPLNLNCDDAFRARMEKLSAGLLFSAAVENTYTQEWLHDPNLTFEPFGHVFRVRRHD